MNNQFFRYFLLLLAFVSGTAFSQEIFWADKEVISSGVSFFSTLKSSDDYIYSAWQQVNYFPDGLGGMSTLIIRRSWDGYEWEEIRHNLEPVEFYGVTPIKNYSMDSTKDGELTIAYLKDEYGIYKDIDIYRLLPRADNLELVSSIRGERGTLNPELYYKGDRGYILFTSGLKERVRDTELNNVFLESGAISIFYQESSDGRTWTENREFVTNDSEQSYLPVYKYFDNKEYVVYQSLVTAGGETSFQLYMKNRVNNGEWGTASIITDFDEYVTGAGNQQFPSFNNQRASFTERGNELGLTWERSYSFETSKIYYSVFDLNTNKLINPEKITTGSRSCKRPKGFEFRGNFFLVWFDNQLGSNDVIMAEPDPQTGLWIEKVISDDRNYTSIFGDFVLFQDSIRIYWEDQNINRDFYNLSKSRVLILNPDRDVDAPLITTSYKSRDNRSVVRFSWTKPQDSSGIKGFFYSWSKKDGDVLFSKEVLSTTTTSEALYADDDGDYEFGVYAQDNAGNISLTTVYTYTFDKTPPDQVDFPDFRTDQKGYLLSNSGSLYWDSWDEDAVGFSYKLSYLGTEFDIEEFDINSINVPSNYTGKKSISFSNIDDGYYALAVRARDIAGNIGKPEALIFKLNKYIPVTYISYIRYNQDENGELVTTIYGRGFKVDGDVTTVILDKDGKEPYDYEFQRDSGVFNVPTDRRIEGPNLDEIEGGTYRVGIIHPIRGKVFSGPIVKVESTGTVKFGDFTKGYEEVWQVVKTRGLRLTTEELIFWIAILIVLILTIFTSIKLVLTARDTKKMFHDANALVKGTPFLSEKEILRIRDMSKRGIGLKVKFTVLIITLVLGVILLISLPLASFMIDTQKQNLTEALINRTEILLNSLSTGAYDYIERDQVLDLDNLIKTSEAMDEVIWATIVGVSAGESEIKDAIWATTDDNIGYFTPLPNTIPVNEFNESIKPELENEELFNKLYTVDGNNYNLNSDIAPIDNQEFRKVLTDTGYPRELNYGETRYSDEIKDDIKILIENIETKGAQEFQSKEEELLRLSADRSKATDRRVQQELQDTIQELSRQIREGLKQMSSQSGIVPGIDYKAVEDYDSYLFYKPILFDEPGISTYYKGMVRIRVSTDIIREEIESSIRELIIRVSITAIVAILIGFLGALVLATFMINPIRKLVAGVKIIRDTDDKSQLKDHSIDLASRDELYTLASTVNQMTEGLVKAAATAKDVTMGKEIQKMFIPLHPDPRGEGKLTTGEFENNEVSIFGYYEGAKGVSGDYFDYKQLDDDHFAMIKCDIAGKGIPASLIMVEVATIFLSYFRNWDKRKNGYRIDELVYSMNDLLEERGFKGRFAALIVVIMNSKTGKCYMCNAGDNLVNIYRHKGNKMETLVLHEVPAAGIFSSDLLEMQGGYKVETTNLKRGDILFLFTDGVEEAKHLFRDENYNEIICEHPGLKEGELHDTHAFHEEFEELGVERINAIIHSVVHRTKYSLKKYHYPQPEAQFTFDFTKLKGEVKDAVLGLIAVEKIFRLNPDPSATVDNVVKVDKIVHQYLLDHFDQFSDYFKFKVDKGEDLPHVYYSHIKEDDQYDDLTILAIKKK